MTDQDYDFAELAKNKPKGQGYRGRPTGKPDKVRDPDDRKFMRENQQIVKPQYNPEDRSYSLLAKEKGRVRHQLSKRFLPDMYDDWRNYGTDVLAAVRADDPSTYLRIMASLVPKTLQIEDSNDGKSTNELRTELLVELGRALERGDAQLTEHIEELQRSERQGPIIEVQALCEAEDVPPERDDSS